MDEPIVDLVDQITRLVPADRMANTAPVADAVAVDRDAGKLTTAS